ncbi:MAG TPA: hypothetical protein VHC40_03650 [Rhizomicrobium sp.]|jgi:hypothetical protein|nr:hypothetical protein [Rhizomicrobium sp.]
MININANTGSQNTTANVIAELFQAATIALVGVLGFLTFGAVI